MWHRVHLKFGQYLYHIKHVLINPTSSTSGKLQNDYVVYSTSQFARYCVQLKFGQYLYYILVKYALINVASSTSVNSQNYYAVHNVS